MEDLKSTDSRFVVCIQNTDHEASLELRKLYCVLTDDEAQKTGFLRIVDESAEDYLYPESYFVAIDLPQTLKDVLLHAA